jgi:membrane protein
MTARTDGRRRSQGQSDIILGARRLLDHSLGDDIIGLSAELAYRFFLAFFPFAIFMASLGALVTAGLGIPNPAERAVELLGDVLPDEATSTVQAELEALVANQSRALLSIGAILALIFATGGTNAIIKALDRVYDVRESRPFWLRYLTALGMTVIAGAAIVSAFALIVPLRVLEPAIAGALGMGEEAALLINLGGVLVALALIVAAATYVYRVAPNIRLPLRTLLPGALLFAVAWVAMTVGLSVWVSTFADYSATYGTLAGVVVLLIWFYASALLFLLAAEFNAVLHELTDPADFARRRRAAGEAALNLNTHA